MAQPSAAREVRERRGLLGRHGDSMQTQKNKFKATLRLPVWGQVDIVIMERALGAGGGAGIMLQPNPSALNPHSFFKNFFKV